MSQPEVVLPREAAEPDENAGVATSDVELAHIAYNLLDHEAVTVMEIARKYQRQYLSEMGTYIYHGNKLDWDVINDILERVGSDMTHEFAERLNLLVKWDPTPVLLGQPPRLDIMDKISSDDIHRYGFDHEQKGYEVRKARDRGEDYLGQKERVNTRRVRDGSRSPRPDQG